METKTVVALINTVMSAAEAARNHVYPAKPIPEDDWSALNLAINRFIKGKPVAQARAEISGTEFVAAISRLQDQHSLQDDQVASALVGIVITLCRGRGEDPLALMQWALEHAARKA